MQRMIPITTPIRACNCGNRPKHWHDASQGGSHFIECSPCGNRTPRFPTFAEAVDSWGRNEIRQITAETIPVRRQVLRLAR